MSTQKPSFFSSQAADQAVAGFVAGAVSTIVLHPLDLVKTRYQVDHSTRRPQITLLETARTLRGYYLHHGIAKGLYAGLSPNFVGATMAWGLYFWCYSALKERQLAQQGSNGSVHVADSGGNLAPSQHLIAAAQAGAVIAFVLNPIWLVKTRMCLQSQDKPQYSGILDALHKIHRTEGINGLYRGLLPGMLAVSHGAIQFMVYEELKRFSATYQERHQSSWLVGPTSESIANGAISKLIAASLTYPYQLVKTRLQADNTSYSGLINVFAKTWRREGMVGFYKGFAPHTLRVLPGTCITFAVYESLSSIFKKNAY